MKIISHKLFFISIILILRDTSIWSYDNDFTHPIVSESSADYLKNKYKNEGKYQTSEQLIKNIAQGSHDEDGKNLAEEIAFLPVREHFYNPITHLGLNVYGHIFNTALTKAINVMKESIELKMNAETPIELGNAYNLLGRVLHLTIQDMAQPQHVHDDPHTITLVGDGSTIELEAEHRVKDNINISIFEKSDVEIPNIFSLGSITTKMALTSYNISSFKGNISPLNNKILEIKMPDNKIIQAKFIPRKMLTGGAEVSCHWEIKGKRKHTLTYFPSITGDGGIIGIVNKQNWWKIPEGTDTYYFDLQADLNAELYVKDKTLENYFIDNLIPTAIAYGAGVIKFFEDITNPPPTLQRIEIADDLNNPVYIMNVIPTGVGEKGRKRQSSFKDDLKFATT
ncbi:MAG: hypothetical protein ACKVQC_08325, partial [Elusimicrobiota bacterium]